MNEETEAQRGVVTCPRSHGEIGLQGKNLRRGGTFCDASQLTDLHPHGHPVSTGLGGNAHVHGDFAWRLLRPLRFPIPAPPLLAESPTMCHGGRHACIYLFTTTGFPPLVTGTLPTARAPFPPSHPHRVQQAFLLVQPAGLGSSPSLCVSVLSPRQEASLGKRLLHCVSLLSHL